MAKVSNLKIQLQEGTENTVYASWTFKDPTPPSGGGTSGGGGGGSGSASIKAGSIVTVKQGSKWYNGASIAPFVYNYQWIVLEAVGDRIVLNKSTSGGYTIMSPIHRNYLNFIR